MLGMPAQQFWAWLPFDERLHESYSQLRQKCFVYRGMYLRLCIKEPDSVYYSCWWFHQERFMSIQTIGLWGLFETGVLKMPNSVVENALFPVSIGGPWKDVIVNNIKMTDTYCQWSKNRKQQLEPEQKFQGGNMFRSSGHCWGKYWSKLSQFDKRFLQQCLTHVPRLKTVQLKKEKRKHRLIPPWEFNTQGGIRDGTSQKTSFGVLPERCYGNNKMEGGVPRLERGEHTWVTTVKPEEGGGGFTETKQNLMRDCVSRLNTENSVDLLVSFSIIQWKCFQLECSEYCKGK